jgi:ribonuclease H2 subunit B
MARLGVLSLFLPYLHTKSSSTSRYKWGILEVQSISPPNPRSWFLNEGEIVAGMVISLLIIVLLYIELALKDGKLLIMTPVDPVFLLLRMLTAIKPVCHAHPSYSRW